MQTTARSRSKRSSAPHGYKHKLSLLQAYMYPAPPKAWMGKAKQAISRLPDNPASAMCKSQLMKSIAESYPRTSQILRLEEVEKQIGDAISNWRSLHEREEGIELLQEARRFLGLAREAEQRNLIALLAT